VARWTTEWQVAEVVEDHEEDMERWSRNLFIHWWEEEDHIMKKREGWRGNILIRHSSMFVVDDIISS